MTDEQTDPTPDEAQNGQVRPEGLEVQAPSNEELNAEVAALVNSNNERLEHLAHHRIQINVQALTLRHLVTMLFPNERDQLLLALNFQQLLATVIEDAESKVDRINLEHSAQQASGLIVPTSVVK